MTGFSPAVRRAVVYASLGGAMFLAASEILGWGLLGPAPAVAIGGSAVLWAWFATSKKRAFYLPIIWWLYYTLGYVVAAGFENLGGDAAFLAGSGRVVPKALVTEAGPTIAGSVVSGVVGLLLAVQVAEWISRMSTHRKVRLNELGLSVLGRRSVVGGLIWAVVSVALMVVMDDLGIGRAGLVPETVLPFRLAGALVYLRNLVVPYVGFLIFVAAWKSGRREVVLAVLALLSGVAVLGSALSLSRAFFAFTLLPVLFYVALVRRAKPRSRSDVLPLGGIALGFVGLAAFVLLGVRFQRDVMYSGNRFGLADSVRYLWTSGSPVSLLIDGLMYLGELAINRVTGLKELALVVVEAQFALAAPWLFFVGRADYVGELNFSLFGLLQGEGEETAFGYGLGLFGMMYLSGRFEVVLVGTFLSAALAMALEEMVVRRGLGETKIFVAVTLGLWFWGGVQFATMWRLVFTLGICALLGERVLRWVSKGMELPRFRGHPMIWVTERSVHDAEEPLAVPAGVPARPRRTGAQGADARGAGAPVRTLRAGDSQLGPGRPR